MLKNIYKLAKDVIGMQRFKLKLLVVIFLMSFFPINLIYAQAENISSSAQDIYYFRTDAQQQRFQNLIQELRCLVCQNQTIADSNAPLAGDLRGQIAKMVALGADETTVKNFLIKRYGNFILYQPPLNHTTFALWFGPLVSLIIGLILVFYVIWKMPAYKLSSQERSKIQKLLNSKET